jgi:hypothetical protein
VALRALEQTMHELSGDPTAAERLRTVPAWIFHGGAEPVIPAMESGKMA